MSIALPTYPVSPNMADPQGLKPVCDFVEGKFPIPSPTEPGRTVFPGLETAPPVYKDPCEEKLRELREAFGEDLAQLEAHIDNLEREAKRTAKPLPSADGQAQPFREKPLPQAEGRSQPLAPLSLPPIGGDFVTPSNLDSAPRFGEPARGTESAAPLADPQRSEQAPLSLLDSAPVFGTPFGR